MVVQFENIKADHDHIKAALASDLPVALGLTLYDSFETREVARNGEIVTEGILCPLPAGIPLIESRSCADAQHF